MKELAKSLIEDGNYDEFPIDEIIAILTQADEEYYNDAESFLDDAEYDVIRFNAKRLAPEHPYFAGVGSDVRGGKIDLPNPMSGLAQVEIGEIRSWLTENDILKEEFVVSDKMDGTSLQLIYDVNGNLQIAYSRGNGIQGADVTRHIRKMKKVPSKIPNGPMVIRAEVELSNTAFSKIQKQVVSSSGRIYKNPRNMTAGMMNKEVAHQVFYDEVDVFTYEIIGTAFSKEDSLKELKKAGLKVVDYSIVKGKDLTDDFLAQYLENRRANLDYDIDGLVISVNNKTIAVFLDEEVEGAADPKSSVKYKVADSSNYHEAEVIGVTYKISKHGYCKPTIQLKPFDLQGVTIRNTTGFNAKFIEENRIAPGAKLLMTRSGDVIPYIVKVVESTGEWVMPDLDEDDYDWNETAVDLVLTDPESHPEVKVQKILDMCVSLELPGLKEGSVRALFDEGIDTEAKMLKVSESKLEEVIGRNGIKIHQGIQNKMGNIQPYELLGSTSFFGHGLGKRKFKSLLEAKDWKLDEIGFPEMDQFTVANVSGVEGFQDKTAEKFISGIPAFKTFYKEIRPLISIKVEEPVEITGNSFENEHVVFTGFRSEDLEKEIQKQGGTIQSGVNKKTTILVVKDISTTSSKAEKARQFGAKIVDKAGLEKLLGKK